MVVVMTGRRSALRATLLLCSILVVSQPGCQDQTIATKADLASWDVDLASPPTPDSGGVDAAIDWCKPPPRSCARKHSLDFQAASGKLAGDPAGFGTLQTIAIGDVNADCKPDIVTGINWDSGFNGSAFLGNGDGSFQVALNFLLGLDPDPVGLVLGDFNGDGKTDIAVAKQDEQRIGVLLGKGDGTFGAVQDFPADVARGLAMGDVDHDGALDLVLAGGSVSLLLGKGDGTFRPAVQVTAGLNIGMAILSDVDADGNLDIIVAVDTKGVAVLRGNGDGTFQPTISTGLPINYLYSLASADLNADGRPDLVVADGYTTNNVVACLSQGDGTFGSCQTLPTIAYPSENANPLLAIADLDGDCRADLAMATDTGVDILLGDGLGGFAAPIHFTTGDNSSFPPGVLAVQDINGDGMPDIVTRNYYNKMSVLLNMSR